VEKGVPICIHLLKQDSRPVCSEKLDPVIATASTIRGAVIRILTPLVRVLLRNGISYGTFADIARQVFVKVAMNEFGFQNRKQTISRVSVLTGLTRKAVKQIIEQPADRNEDVIETYNRATRVIAGWRNDNAFQTEKGAPADLPLSGQGASFSALVKKYSGDCPVRAVLDELVRTNVASVLEDGSVRLRTRADLASDGDLLMKLHLLGTDTGHLITTIAHNLKAKKSKAFFQRKVFYDNLPLEALAPFRRLSAIQAQALLEQLDVKLSQQDRNNHPQIKGTGRYAAGVGIYYFEDNLDPKS
jgi:hypothetical protein